MCFFALQRVSARTLKPDSLDLDPQSGSMLSRVNSRCYEDCAHCTAGLDLMHCPMQHSKQLGSGSRSCGGKVVFGFESPIRIGSRSKVPCGEPQSWQRANQGWLAGSIWPTDHLLRTLEIDLLDACKLLSLLGYSLRLPGFLLPSGKLKRKKFMLFIFFPCNTMKQLIEK